MKTILVTGGAGYVGAVLVPKLLHKGYRVKVLDLFLYAPPSLFSSLKEKGFPVECLSIDLREREAVQQALKGVDTVIHLAGISNDPSSDLSPNLTKEINIYATQNLIEDSKKAGVGRFINASSSSVYGIKEEPNVTEDLPLEPLTIYSESKAIIEKYLRENRGSMTSVSIRSATVCGYSPRLRLDLTVNILTHHALCKKKITVFGGTQKRPNIHIDDITDLYLSLVEVPSSLIDGKEFNACGANHTVMEIAELVRKEIDPSLPIEVVPTNDLRSYHISNQRIEKELGFKPKKSISQAISDLKDAFENGLVPNPEDEIYYNVKTMKNLVSKGALADSISQPALHDR